MDADGGWAVTDLNDNGLKITSRLWLICFGVCAKVSLTCGVHVDNASKDFYLLLQKFKKKLVNLHKWNIKDLYLCMWKEIRRERINQKVTNTTDSINPKICNRYALHDTEERKLFYSEPGCRLQDSTWEET